MNWRTSDQVQLSDNARKMNCRTSDRAPAKYQSRIYINHLPTYFLIFKVKNSLPAKIKGFVQSSKK